MKNLIFLGCFSLVLSLASGAVCPDGSSCTDDQTCCAISDVHYGCCPLVDAVCCDDRAHCCPSGYTCAQGLCTKISLAGGTRTRMRSNSSIVCPGGQFSCDDGNTCCPAGDAFTCCPLPDATCCSDGEHCCPQGTTCDLAHQSCNVPISKIASGAALRQKETVVICPGDEFQCPDDTTCCMMTTGEYGCCPLPNAVCCDDKIHCCPSGYVCNDGICAKAVSNSSETPQTPLAKIEHLGHSEESSVICPDETSECPDGNTCCMLSSGAYGCCPLEQAECCSDHIHCCPHGMHCDVAKGGCESGEDMFPDVVPWVEKMPAIQRRLHADENPLHP